MHDGFYSILLNRFDTVSNLVICFNSVCRIWSLYLLFINLFLFFFCQLIFSLWFDLRKPDTADVEPSDNERLVLHTSLILQTFFYQPLDGCGGWARSFRALPSVFTDISENVKHFTLPVICFRISVNFRCRHLSVPSLFPGFSIF